MLPGNGEPQTIVTTHSPTLAASIDPSRLHILTSSRTGASQKCNSFGRLGLEVHELKALRRMMDVTKANTVLRQGHNTSRKEFRKRFSSQFLLPVWL